MRRWIDPAAFFVLGFVAGRSFFGTLVAVFVAINIANVVWHWWLGRQGLDQWPDPHGRYYAEWLRYEGPGDYYGWLAARMGNREPWHKWAVLEARRPE